jgi:hypothetical protein
MGFLKAGYQDRVRGIIRIYVYPYRLPGYLHLIGVTYSITYPGSLVFFSIDFVGVFQPTGAIKNSTGGTCQCSADALLTIFLPVIKNNKPAASMHRPKKNERKRWYFFSISGFISL